MGSFVNGLFLAFLPATLLPVLGKLGFANTTFGDFDFGVFGILLGNVGNSIGQIGVYLICSGFSRSFTVTIHHYKGKYSFK